MSDPVVPEPDDKDWTWTLLRPCPDCGFAPAEVPAADIATITRELAARWLRVLARPAVDRRPEPAVWSPLEYAAHVRDVYEIFGDRARLILTQDEPTFANWDQDATAVQKRYWRSDPTTVAAEIDDRARNTAAVFAAVWGDKWDRRGRRSNGSSFTVYTLGVYFLHDLVHHLHDVRG